LKRFCSYRELAAQLDAAARSDKFDTISFDVFDTLIHRRVAPEIVVDSVARTLQHLIIEHGLNAPASCLLRCRDQAYLRLTAVHVSKGLDPDTTLDELALTWVAEATGLPIDAPIVVRIAREIVATEAASERRVAYGNVTLAKLLPTLRGRGARLLAISDMYLGHAHVAPLLADAGMLDCFDAVYVSGDHRLLKRTGRLFGHVCAQENIIPGRWLHIGDNFEVDGIAATRQGAQAWIINDRQHHGAARGYQFDAARLITAKQEAGQMIACYAQAKLPDRLSDEAQFGFCILGPILCAFVHRVLERCREQEIEQIYFLAREGHILQMLFRRLAPLVYAKHPPPASRYLAASRLTSFLAAMTDFGDAELAAVIANSARHTLRNLLSPLQIPEKMLDSIARRHGLADSHSESIPDPMHAPVLRSLLADEEVAGWVREKAAQARTSLHAYLHQSGWFDTRQVALVDIGWGGQIQDNLVRSLAGQQSVPAVYGLYLGANAQAVQRDRPGCHFEGLIADARSPHWSADAAFEFVFALETACRAPHGTTIGYATAANGRVIPLFRDDDAPSRQAELRGETFIAQLQAGVLAYAQHYLDATELLGSRGTDALPYARLCVERMVRYPNARETLWWSTLANVSDLGSETTLDLGYTGKLSTLGKIRAARRSSLFPYGLAGKLGGQAAQAMLSIYRGMKRGAPPDVPAPTTTPILPKTRYAPCCAPPSEAWEVEIDDRFRRLQQTVPAPTSCCAGPMTGLRAKELLPLMLSYTLTSLLYGARGRQRLSHDFPSPLVLVRRSIQTRFNLGGRWELVRRMGRRLVLGR
jgi:hypothetical protein